MVIRLMHKFLTSVFLLVASVSCWSAESDWVRNTRATNLPSFLAASATSNATHFLQLRPDRSAGLFVTGIGTNNATNNLTIGVRGSIDGVFTNSFPLFSLIASVTGTNQFRHWTNLSLGTLPFIHLGPLTNGATGVSNLTVWIEIPK